MAKHASDYITFRPKIQINVGFLNAKTKFTKNNIFILVVLSEMNETIYLFHHSLEIKCMHPLKRVSAVLHLL